MNSPIDISQFTNKRVKITFRNGFKKEGDLHFNTSSSSYKYVFSYQSSEYSIANISYNRDGKVEYDHMLDIAQIEELESVIDLSKFVDKNVRVSYRDGQEAEVIIQKGNAVGSYPYRIYGVSTYAKNGLVYGSPDNKHPYDIIDIELLDSGDRVEYLENRVSILQRQIDCVNAEIAKIKNEKVVIAQEGDWKVEKRGSQAYILLRNCPMIDIEYKTFLSLVGQCSDLVNTPD